MAGNDGWEGCMTMMELGPKVRRASLPKRPVTPGAYEVDLVHEVDYGDGPVDETYARQLVVECYPPGSATALVVTEKAYHHVYRPKGYTLTPGEVVEPTADEVAAVRRTVTDGVDDALAEAAAEMEAERLAREAAEEGARAQQRALAEAQRALADMSERLRRLEDADAEQPVKAGGKGGK